ncbi:YppE family protein [Bacillus sp. J33]|uniref:YppE family protein n=1 Tax=Bacillus sp. J33 TaxID=935836 RepID=UPI0004789DD0|nr:YppE family protein [Bacillus sp. J33]
MVNEKVLLQLTEGLLNYVQISDERYKQVKESGEKGDFYNEVKPFADEVKAINDKWRGQAAEWVKMHRPRNLYPQQIDSASEHIEMVSIQAFFPETSKSRFINYVNSAIYVLKQLTALLSEEKRGT